MKHFMVVFPTFLAVLAGTVAFAGFCLFGAGSVHVAREMGWFVRLWAPLRVPAIVALFLCWPVVFLVAFLWEFGRAAQWWASRGGQ